MDYYIIFLVSYFTPALDQFPFFPYNSDLTFLKNLKSTSSRFVVQIKEATALRTDLDCEREFKQLLVMSYNKLICGSRSKDCWGYLKVRAQNKVLFTSLGQADFLAGKGPGCVPCSTPRILSGLKK